MITLLFILYFLMLCSSVLPFYRHTRNRYILLSELLLYFWGVPLTFCFFTYTPDTVMLIINFGGLCFILIYLSQYAIMLIRILSGLDPVIVLPKAHHWKPFLFLFGKRALLASLCLTLLLFLFDRHQLLGLLREPGALWRISLYSFVSAFPQEFIYRKFWFDRYATMLPRSFLLLANSLTFAFMHIIFWHPIPLLLTFIAGWWISSSYLRFRSVLFASLEHAVYGSLAFLIGYHTYFHFIK